MKNVKNRTSFLEIYKSGIMTMGSSYLPIKSIFRFLNRNKMDMVGHQAIRPNLFRAAIAPFGHQIQIFQVIGFGKEGFHPPVTALSNVM